VEATLDARRLLGNAGWMELEQRFVNAEKFPVWAEFLMGDDICRVTVTAWRHPWRTRSPGEPGA
jgi:hypothetical protein